MRPTALLFPLAALTDLGLAVPIETPLDPTDIVDALTDITAVCEDLMGPASQINVVTAPLLLLGAGPLEEIRKGFEYVATILDDLGAQRPPATPFTASEARAVTDGFQAYSTAQTGLLDSVAQAGGGVVGRVPGIGPAMKLAVGGTAVAVNRFADMLANSIGPTAEGVTVAATPLVASFSNLVSTFT